MGGVGGRGPSGGGRVGGLDKPSFVGMLDERRCRDVVAISSGRGGNTEEGGGFKGAMSDIRKLLLVAESLNDGLDEGGMTVVVSAGAGGRAMVGGGRGGGGIDVRFDEPRE